MPSPLSEDELRAQLEIFVHKKMCDLEMVPWVNVAAEFRRAAMESLRAWWWQERALEFAGKLLEAGHTTVAEPDHLVDGKYVGAHCGCWEECTACSGTGDCQCGDCGPDEGNRAPCLDCSGTGKTAKKE